MLAVVAHVQRWTWQPGDAAAVAKSLVVIGRARVVLVGGATIDALLCASTESRTLGQRFALYFEPSSGRLVAEPMEAS